MLLLFLVTMLSIAVLHFSPIRADDRFTCCMAGWKEIRGVTMCPGPCCHGYEERILDLPLLQRPSVCHRLTEEEMAERQKIQALLKEKILLKKTKPINKTHPIMKGKWGLPLKEDVASLETQVLPMKNPTKNEPSKGASEDQPIPPQRSERAAFEFEDFLLRHKQLFIHFLSEGISRKELIAGFEEFLASINTN